MLRQRVRWAGPPPGQIKRSGHCLRSASGEGWEIRALVGAPCRSLSSVAPMSRTCSLQTQCSARVCAAGLRGPGPPRMASRNTCGSSREPDTRTDTGKHMVLGIGRRRDSTRPSTCGSRAFSSAEPACAPPWATANGPASRQKHLAQRSAAMAGKTKAIAMRASSQRYQQDAPRYRNGQLTRQGPRAPLKRTAKSDDSGLEVLQSLDRRPEVHCVREVELGRCCEALAARDPKSSGTPANNWIVRARPLWHDALKPRRYLGRTLSPRFRTRSAGASKRPEEDSRRVVWPPPF